MNEEIKAKLKAMVVETLNLDDVSVDDIQDDMSLFDSELALDSIDALELIVLLEKDYGIKLTDPAQGKEIFVSINQMAQFIEENRTK